MRKSLALAAAATVLSFGMMAGAEARPSASAADMVKSLASQSQSMVQEARWRRCHWVKRCNWRRCYWVRRCHRWW